MPADNPSLLGGKTMKELLEESAKRLDNISQTSSARTFKVTQIDGLQTTQLYPNSVSTSVRSVTAVTSSDQ